MGDCLIRSWQIEEQQHWGSWHDHSTFLLYRIDINTSALLYTAFPFCLTNAYLQECHTAAETIMILRDELLWPEADVTDYVRAREMVFWLTVMVLLFCESVYQSSYPVGVMKTWTRLFEYLGILDCNARLLDWMIWRPRW